jgi:chromosome segregation ATPase
MEIFNLGNVIVLVLSLFALAVTRRLDQQNKSVDGVRRFFDKAKKDFDAYVEEHQKRLYEMTVGFDSYEKNSREILAHIEKESQFIAGESGRLNEVKDLVIQLLNERQAVQDGINNLKEDAKFVNKLASAIDVVGKRVAKIEESSGLLLSELASSNEAALAQQKEKVLEVFVAESAEVKEQLEAGRIGAELLKDELGRVLQDKEEALIRSLKVYKAELERIDGLYAERLRELESQAQAMETEGLYQIRENLEEQFSKVKSLTESLFEQETSRFREALNIQINEFEVFTTKYRNIEADLAERFDLLDAKAGKMAEEHEQFSNKMQNLYTFMEEEFGSEAEKIRSILNSRISELEERVSNESRADIAAFEQNLRGNLDKINVMAQDLNDRLVSFDAEYNHKRDIIAEKIAGFESEVDSELEHKRQLFDEMLRRHEEERQRNEEQMLNDIGEHRQRLATYTNEARKILEQQRDYSEKLKEENRREFENAFTALREEALKSVEEERGRLLNIFQISLAGEKEEIDAAVAALKQERDSLFAGERELLVTEAATVRAKTEEELAVIKFTVEELLLDKAAVLQSEINRQVEEATKRLTEESGLKITAAAAAWEAAANKNEARANALSAQISETDRQLHGRIEELDAFYSGIMQELREKEDSAGRQQENWYATFAEMERAFKNELESQRERLQGESARRVHEAEGAVTTLWNERFKLLNEELEKRLSSGFEALEQIDSRVSKEIAELDAKLGERIEQSRRMHDEWQQKFIAAGSENAARFTDIEEQIERTKKDLYAAVEAARIFIESGLKTLKTEAEEESSAYRENLKSKLQLWEEHLNKTVETNEEKLQSAVHQADELAEAWTNQFNTLSLQLRQQVSGLEDKIAETAGRHESFIDERFEAWRQNSEAAIDSNNRLLEQVYNEAMQSVQHWGKEFEQLRAVINTKVDLIDNETSGISEEYRQTLAERLREWQARGDDILNESESKFAEARRVLDENIGTWHSRLAVLSRETEELAEQMRSQLETSAHAYKDDITEKLTAWKNENENLIVSGNLKTEQARETMEAQIAAILQRFDELDRQYNSLTASRSESYKELERSFAALVEEAEEMQNEKFRLLHEDTAARIEEARAFAEQLKSEILNEGAGLEGKLGEYRMLLERRFAENTAQFDLLIDESDKKHEQILEDVGQRLSEVKEEISRQLDNFHSEQLNEEKDWEQRYTVLAERYNERERRLQEQLSELDGKIEQRLRGFYEDTEARLALAGSGLDERIAQVDVRAELIEGAWSERYDRYTKDLSVRLTETEQTIESSLADWKERLDGLQGDLDERLGEASRLADDVAGRWRQSFEELQKVMDERAVASQEQVDALEKVWAERFAGVQRLITERLETSRAWTGEIEERWQNHYNELEARLRKQANESLDVAELIEKEWRHRYSMLNEAFTTLQKDIEAEITAHKNQLTEKNGAWETDYQRQLEVIKKSAEALEEVWHEKFNELNVRLDSRFADVDKETEELEKSWKEYLDKVDASAQEHLEEAEHRLTLIEEEWLGRGDELTKGLSERLALIEQESAALLLQLDERNRNFDHDYTYKMELSAGRLHELEQLWDERYENLKALITERADKAFDEVVNVEERWRERFAELRRHTDEQLHQAEQESVGIEDLWRQKLRNVYNDVDAWLLQVEASSAAYAKQLEAAWEKHFSQLNEGEESRLAEAERQAKEIEAFWNERIGQLNSILEEKLAEVDDQTQNYVSEAAALWQQRLDTAKEEFNQHFAEADLAGNELEERWRAHFSRLDEQFNAYLADNSREADKIAEIWREKLNESYRNNEEQLSRAYITAQEIEKNWQERYAELSKSLDAQVSEVQESYTTADKNLRAQAQELAAGFEKQLRVFADKNAQLDHAKEIIDKRIENLEQSTFDNIALQQENLRRQITEQLRLLADEMRADWEENLGDLKVSFTRSIEESKSVVHELAEHRMQVENEKELFSSKIFAMTAEAQEIFGRNAQTMDELFSTLNGNFEQWRSRYSEQLNEVEAALNARSSEIEESSRIVTERLEQLEAVSSEQQQLFEQEWRLFTENFNHEKATFIGENREELQQMQAEFGAMLNDFKNRQDEIVALLNTKQHEALTKGSAVEQDFERLIEKHQKLFAEKTLEINSLLSEEQELFKAKSENYLAKAEQAWNSFLEQFGSSEEKYHEQLDRQIQRFELKFNHLEKDFANKEELIKEKFNSRLKEVDAVWNTISQEIKQKGAQFDAEFSTRIDEAFYSLTTIEDRLNLKQEAFEESFGERLNAAVENLTKVQEEFDARQHNFDRTLNEQMERAKNNLLRLEEEFGDKQNDFDMILQERIEEAAVKMARIEEEFQNRRTDFEHDLAERLRQAEQEVAMLTETFEERHRQVEENFENRINMTLSTVNSLERDLVSKGEQLDTLIHEGLGNVRNELDRLSGELAENQRQSFDELSARLNKNIELFDERFARSEAETRRRSADLEALFTALETDFLRRRDTLYQEFSELENQFKEKAVAYDMQRELITQEFGRFKQSLESYFEERGALLRQNIDGRSEEIEHRLSELISARFTEASTELSTVVAMIDKTRSEAEQKMTEQRMRFADDFTKMEELIARAGQNIEEKYAVFTESREELESELMQYRLAATAELKRQETELQALIEAGVKQTAEDLSLEFMGGLEQRLNDYEDALKVRMSRIENFIHDIDGLESSLRLSMKDIQENIISQLAVFESDIRMRQEREVERASAILSAAQDSFARVMDKSNESISQLQVQVDELRRKALDNVTGRLSVFEEGFLEEIKKRENNLLMKITEWQQTIDVNMDAFEKRKDTESRDLEQKFELEQQNFIRSFEQKIETEFMRFSNEISAFADNLESRAKSTEEELDRLRSGLNNKIDFFVSQAEEEFSEKLRQFQDKIGAGIDNSDELAQKTLQEIDVKLGRHQNELDEKLSHIKGKVEQNIMALEEMFSQRTDKLIGDSTEERRKIHLEYEELERRAQKLAADMEQKRQAVSETLEHFSSKTHNDMVRKGDALIEEIDDKMQRFSSESEKLRRDTEQLQKELNDTFTLELTKLKEELAGRSSKIYEDIERRADKIDGQLISIEERQRTFEENVTVFKQAEQMRIDLENSLVDISERMAKIEGRREEVVHLQTQLDKAFRINESLAEKLASMARERQRFDELDGRIAHIMELSSTIDARFGQISGVTETLQEVQARLRGLEDYEKELGKTLEVLDKRIVIAESTTSGISTNFDKMRELELELNGALQQLTAMQDELTAARRRLEDVNMHQPKIDYLLDFFNTADQKLSEMEGQVTRIDQMRDWMVQAEKRFTELQSDIRTGIKTLGAVKGRDSEGIENGRVGKADDTRGNEDDIIGKLAEQGWSAERIASHLKMSLTEVSLILERRRNR